MSNARCSSKTCPFSHKACTECAAYRGRHRFVGFSRCAGSANDPRGPIAGYFAALEEQSDPWAGATGPLERASGLRLTLVDVETTESRAFDLEEARGWDWKNPSIMRLIEGRQLKSFDALVEILAYRARQGEEEVSIREYPRFMLLAGG